MISKLGGANEFIEEKFLKCGGGGHSVLPAFSYS